MTRRVDWEHRLADYLDSVRAKRYAFGSHDCLTHAANAVKAMTGADYARGLRRKYRSMASGIRLLREIGYDSIPALVTAKLGDPIPPALARRGDIVLFEGSTGVAMTDFAYFVGNVAGEPDGLVRVPRAQWESAWRV
ncbi:DUF6950 family protein [Sphingomonas montanisoli]|uniref:DUF6950 domain-containing protein n=1 Tax=Sphingomonas montanisoli TaxID=2606412 RepID=A0A5D9C2C6_9SPHN|nr:hypothetical protein [Sphingomonas montanisoli]TZG25573.1 hypothetical protein FYJ91_11130 [Sphingomonas montanisoli]